jgi:hypothetical protein
MKATTVRILTLLIVAAGTSRAAPAGYELSLKEASGITARNDTLFMVGDENPGRYFALPVTDTSLRVLAIEPSQLEEIPFPGCELASDLEAIDILADGRIVAISEDLTAMIGLLPGGNGRCGLIARYMPSLSEFGNLGLEGLAVQPAPHGASQIAVLWEGGYPAIRYMPHELVPLARRHAFHPLVVMHTLPADSIAGWVARPDSMITLNVPTPRGSEPDAMRYRASDLVWHTWHENGEPVEGFIAIIAAYNSPVDSSPAYNTGELLRFKLNGDPVGTPLDLHAEAARSLNDLSDEDIAAYSAPVQQHVRNVRDIFNDSDGSNANFEGLGWFRPGKRLVIVFDSYPVEPTLVFFIDLPDDWR